MNATAATPTYSQTNVPRFLAILILAAISLAAIVYSSHAVERHGQGAIKVRQCLENNGPTEVWQNPDTLREAHICQLDDGKYGIQIQRFEREITSFVKNKLRTIEQVHKYLDNGGYTVPLGQ
jgi:hypothetical protein